MVTESHSIEEIIRGIRNSTYKVETEGRLAGAGLKEEQDIAGVLEEYAWLYNLKTVYRMQEAYSAEADLLEKERLRRVYYYLLGGYLGRQTAEKEDEIVSFEIGATVKVDGERLPYYDVPVLIAGEPDFEKRDRLQDAALVVVEQTNPHRLAVVRDRLATLADKFGYDNYTAYNSEKKRLDYNLLRSRLEAFLLRTESTYSALMGEWAEEATGWELGKIGDHHFSYISRMPQYDAYFGKDELLDVYQRTLVGLGLDPASQKNIHLDTADRPTKNPQARCYVPNPPEEIHLVIKPVGGLEDYAAFLHEAGHAQHYGNTDPTLDYVNRVVPTSYGHAEIYSFLMEYLTMNRAWLVEVVGLPEQTAWEVVYRKKLVEFYFVRRYVAKLCYELDFFADPLNEGRNQELYATTLAAATGLLHPPQKYLQETSVGDYSADYLRAWITEAMLRRNLENTYGEGWFAHPAAGAFLRELWASGEARENEDVARMIGHEPFDTTYLAEQFLALERTNF